MSDTANAVDSLRQRLAVLQQRLADLESQRSATKYEIAVCQAQIAATVRPSPNTSTRIQVLWVMRQFDDRALSPLEICNKLGLLHYSDQNSVRLLLTRLRREGKITKTSHGHYQINPGV
jgi:hypothetical protein